LQRKRNDGQQHRQTTDIYDYMHVVVKDHWLYAGFSLLQLKFEQLTFMEAIYAKFTYIRNTDKGL